MEENHHGLMAAHFSGHRLFNVLSQHWWCEGMYNDTRQYVSSCPECVLILEEAKFNTHNLISFLFPEHFRSLEYM